MITFKGVSLFGLFRQAGSGEPDDNEFAVFCDKPRRDPSPVSVAERFASLEQKKSPLHRAAPPSDYIIEDPRPSVSVSARDRVALTLSKLTPFGGIIG